jgi:hypothetical protein
MNERFKGILSWRRFAIALGVTALAGITWRFTSGPVLLHTHAFEKVDYRSCGAYNDEGVGLTILNPFRSRAPERTADTFLRATSQAKCLPDINDEMCKFVIKRPLPATEWRLVYRRDFGKGTWLYYRLNREAQKAYRPCAVAEVHLERTATSWNPTGYGLSY